MTASRCNVLVYGGGAVGSIFGWRIAQHGHARVSVVCRSNWQAVRDGGFHMKTLAWGNGYFRPEHVYRAGAIESQTPDRAFDYIVCANKITDDGSSTLRDLRGLVHPKTVLVAAQNGMDVELPLQRSFPNNTVLAAICNIGCNQVRPGWIEQTGCIKRPAFLIGLYGKREDEGSDVDMLKRDYLASLDPEFESIDSVSRERWRKLVFNSAWNSTTALTGLNTHQLLEQPGAADLVGRLADEAYRVGVASGVQLSHDLPSKTIELARSSPAITPSTLQDAQKRRPMELAPIFGYLTSQASKVAVHVPYMTWIYRLLQQKNSAFLAQEQTVRGPTPWRSFASVEELSGKLQDSRLVMETM